METFKTLLKGCLLAVLLSIVVGLLVGRWVFIKNEQKLADEHQSIVGLQGQLLDSVRSRTSKIAEHIRSCESDTLQELLVAALGIHVEGDETIDSLWYAQYSLNEALISNLC